MPHPMYKIDEELKKFPLFGEALENTDSEIEGALYYVLGEIPLIGLPKKIIETVDKNLDGTDAEKQAIMIGALYALAPNALMLDMGQGGVTYDAETQAVLAELAAYDKKSVAGTKMSQVTAVLNIAIAVQSLPMASEAPEPLPPEAIAEVKRGMADGEKLFLPNLDAPRLEAAYRETAQTLLDAMSGKPAARRPGGKYNTPKI